MSNQAELNQFASELERFTPSRRFAVTVLVTALVLVWRVGGLNKFLVAIAGLLSLVLALPKVNDWLDKAVPALDKRLNG